MTIEIVKLVNDNLFDEDKLNILIEKYIMYSFDTERNDLINLIKYINLNKETIPLESLINNIINIYSNDDSEFYEISPDIFDFYNIILNIENKPDNNTLYNFIHLVFRIFKENKIIDVSDQAFNYILFAINVSINTPHLKQFLKIPKKGVCCVNF